MKHILRQTALTLLSFTILYVLLGGASFLVFQDPPGGGPRDFQAAERTLYMTVPKYVVLGRSVLDNPGRKVILVGASNTSVGFRQAMVQPNLSCAGVSNLGMGGANISEVKQVIDLVHEVQNEQNRRLNTFVIGTWFGMFVDSDVKYAEGDRHRGETDVDIELYRYGFYRRTPDGAVAVLPPKWLDWGVTALRPFLLFEKLARQTRASVNLVLTGRTSVQRTDDERESVVMSEREKQEALEYWKVSMGGKDEISRAQVDVLKETIAALLDSDEKVLLVDLPIPAWHRDASPYQRGYQEALKGVVQEFSRRPNFASLSMDDLDENLDYSDEVHAKRHLAQIWSTRLAMALNSFVCQEKDDTEPPVATLQSSERVLAAPKSN
ncbi:hypothetical protein QA640_34330 [Bradyrhizobium sp. CB82]|uniref:hypothetical protein n=1 Tax=Bradyrhizobium sp. CB82 TaxID=3039159 RepID=UPI0024B04053|nr:hypothetical protein [Bradyrhizobium sp. CB82]WFU39401.1 hypothetical protein QA640_34330 [Bradyrhizobium sp. CB82]